MASFEQNIRNIRGEAIYGMEVRSAIADAIEQSVGYDMAKEFYESWQSIHHQLADNKVIVEVFSMSPRANLRRLSMTNVRQS